MMGTVRERFYEKFLPRPSTGCWIWTGVRETSGYGRLYVTTSPGNYLRVRASRLSWELHVGPIPEGMFVCHRCDVRSCVNPDHLFLGTNADNVQDMTAKGRNGREGGALSIEQAREIDARLRNGERHFAIAKDYGVRSNSITAIANGTSWGWLTGRAKRIVGTPRGERHPKRILSEAQVLEIARLLRAGAKQSDLAAQFGVRDGTINGIARGKTWGWLTGIAVRDICALVGEEAKT